MTVTGSIRAAISVAARGGSLRQRPSTDICPAVGPLQERGGMVRRQAIREGVSRGNRAAADLSSGPTGGGRAAAVRRARSRRGEYEHAFDSHSGL